ncbi:hypothetical protein PTSG_11476, partial [Salpingoeca rosetta]
MADKRKSSRRHDPDVDATDVYVSSAGPKWQWFRTFLPYECKVKDEREISEQFGLFTVDGDAPLTLQSHRDTQARGALSNPRGRRRFHPLREADDEQVLQWRRCLFQEMKHVVRVAELVYDCRGEYLHTAIHYAPIRATGAPMRGSGSGRRHFRARGFTAAFIQGMYEFERRQGGLTQAAMNGSHLCHRGQHRLP